MKLRWYTRTQSQWQWFNYLDDYAVSEMRMCDKVLQYQDYAGTWVDIPHVRETNDPGPKPKD